MKSFMKNVLFVIVVIGFTSVSSLAQTVWSGYDCSFEKADFADWTLEENQDRITDTIWITRQHREGIFNIFSEDDYVTGFSPDDTEWSYGHAVDWATLTFTDWRTWARSQGSVTSILDQDAVVHLISYDIYIDIRFTAWTTDASGGGFAYVRACEPVSPTPTPDQCINDGDVTMDGSVTAGDAQLGFQIALGSYMPSMAEACAADCNGDDSVTAGDAQQIFFVVLGSGVCMDPV